MAQQIADIQKQITTAVAADPVLSELDSPSQVAVWQLFTFIVAVAGGLLQQLWDIFTAQIEAVVALAAPATPAWVQNQVLNFQYSDTNPQVVQFGSNFQPGYATVDPTLRIISRCSVTTNINNTVNVKVATGTPPGPLSSLQLTALQSYLDLIMPAGITYNAISLGADRLYVQAIVYFNGQYSQVIQTNVIAAITNYLAGIPFNGTVTLTALMEAILAVSGVTDVKFVQVQARQATDAFSAGVILVNNAQWLLQSWNTISGYIIPEDDAGETPDVSLTFTPAIT